MLLLAFLLSPLHAASVDVSAYDPSGKKMDAPALLRRIAPADAGQQDLSPARSGLRACAPSGRALQAGWEKGSMRWTWSGSERAVFSLPWPVDGEGFSTISFDGEGEGYVDGQTVLLNEHAAKTAWRGLRAALDARKKKFAPPYAPGRKFQTLFEKAKADLFAAKAAPAPADRARLCDKALGSIAAAWQEMSFEHGLQSARHPSAGKRLRNGLTLDPSLDDFWADRGRVLDKLSDSGAGWVRLLFKGPESDPAFAQASSFSLYDELVKDLKKRGMEVLGVLASTSARVSEDGVSMEAARAAALARRYRQEIRSWEVAEELNGPDEGRGDSQQLRLSAALSAAAAVKAEDPGLETVFGLRAWEGTALSGRSLLDWLAWAEPRGFGKDADAVLLSLHPEEDPLGIFWDSLLLRLDAILPPKTLIFGRLSFPQEKTLRGYWWLEPGMVEEPRKDLLIFNSGAFCAMPRSSGGLFFPLQGQLLDPDGKTSGLYPLYRGTLKRLRR